MQFKNSSPLGWAILAIALIATIFFGFCDRSTANQLGVTLSEGTLGGLGDFQHKRGAWTLEADAQAQRTDTLSAVANVGVIGDLFQGLGINPFISLVRDDVGNTFDAGTLLNFSVGGLNVAAGASFRGANPTSDARVDANGFTMRAGYNIETGEWDDANAYKLPAAQNINAAFKSGFEWNKVETDLTLYVPITEREVVPVVVISRSQTSIELTDALSLAFVVDWRAYVHSDGVELALKPIGSINYRFRGF